MRDLLIRKRLMMVICLVATLGLAACGDDGGGNNGNNGGGNNGADAGGQDTGDQDAGEQDTGDQDTGDQGTDTGGGEGGPDITGFTAPSGMEMDETATAWSLFGQTETQFIQLSLSKDGGATGPGAVQFQDVALSEAANLLVLANGCSDQGCEAFFLAIAGTLDITTFETDVEAGSFEATLTDVELVEIEQTQAGFEQVQGGKTWLIENSELTATTDPSDTFPETVACDTEGFTDEGSVSLNATEGGAFVSEAASTDTPPVDLLSLQIYPSFDGAAVDAGTYQLDDFSFESCSNCLLIYAGCDAEDVCEKTFIAGAGQLEITNPGTVDGAFSVGEQFTATLTDAKLVEVTIDRSYDTEIVADGASWCIPSFSWDGTLTAPAMQ